MVPWFGVQMKTQWEQLYESLRSEIRAGGLAPGERLPTEHELSARHGVSRNTVRRAYLALSQEGAIRSVNGRGSFVMQADITYEIDAVSRFRDVLEQQGLASSSRLVEISELQAGSELSQRLNLELGARVISHTAVITGDGVPFILTTRYFPAHVIADLKQKLMAAGSFTRILADAGLGELRRKSTIVGAQLADERTAALLECNRNAPLLDVSATGMLANGTIVEWQHAMMNSRLIKLSFLSN
jgi:GntR family transcriptional regulator, phosphonate transport system regulatory protein